MEFVWLKDMDHNAKQICPRKLRRFQDLMVKGRLRPISTELKQVH